MTEGEWKIHLQTCVCINKKRDRERQRKRLSNPLTRNISQTKGEARKSPPDRSHSQVKIRPLDNC